MQVATDGANRNVLRLLQPTLDTDKAAGLHHDITMLHLDSGDDYPKTRAELVVRDYTELDIQRRGTKPLPLDARPAMDRRSHELLVVQLHHSTDSRTRHRHAALCLATAVLIVGRLIDHRNRWSAWDRRLFTQALSAVTIRSYGPN